MRDKIKKWALLKAADGLNKMADGLNVASGTLAALAAAARINASDEVWGEPLPCDCPACQLKRMLGIDGDGPMLVRIPSNPGDLLGKAIREAGADPDGPCSTSA